MPDRIITAEALISAKDATGDVFVNIARKLGEIGKGAKASVEVERLSKTLADASKQAEKIGQFRVASKTLDAASLSMAKTRLEAAKLGQQIAGMDKPTATMTGQLTQAERAVVRSTDAFRRQGTAVMEARRVLEASGTPINRLGAEQERLKGVITSTTSALEKQIGVERQAAVMAEKVAGAQRDRAKAEAAAGKVAQNNAERRQEGIGHHGIGNYVAGAVAGAVSAHGVMTVLEKALEAGADRQSTLVGMKNAGMKDDEIRRAQDLAVRVSRDAPNLNVSQILELHKEARSGVQHPEEVFELMPDLARATSVLKGMGAQNANIADIVKAGESLGLMNDPKRFHTFLDSQIRAMKVMGRTVTTEQIYEGAKYSKSAGATLSDDFLNLTMPSLIQEMKGQSAGDALAMVTKTLRGGLQHKHVPVTRLQELGLLDDPSQIRRSKTGEILGYTGKVKGDDLLATDPDRWFLQYFDKAAEAHGYTKLADKTKLLSETLPGTAANLGRIVIQQRESLTNHRQLYRDAPDLEQSVEIQRHDPKVAMQTFTAALSDLEAAVTGPAMDTLGLGLGRVSGYIRDLADAAKAHPNIAMGAGAGAATAGLLGSGYLAYQISQGFGLKTSATQLDGAALALKEAAGALGAHGSAGGPGGQAPGEGKPSGGYSLGSSPWFAALGLGSLALGAPGLDEAGDKQRDANATALGGLGKTLGFGYLDEARERIFGKNGDVTTWFGGLIHGSSSDSASAARDAAIHRTERQRLLTHPLEGGLDRMRAEMTGENAPLPLVRPFTPTPAPPAPYADREAERGQAMMAIPRPMDRIERFKLLQGLGVLPSWERLAPMGPPMPPAAPYVDREAERGRAMDRPMSIDPAILALTEAARRIQSYDDDRATRARDIGGPPRQFDTAAPSIMRPADADDRAAERADAIRKFNEDLGLSGFVMGQLNDKTGIVLASFDGLNGGVGALNTGLGELGTGSTGLRGSLDILSQTAMGAARALAEVAMSGGGEGTGGPGGGSGIINASFGGGGGAGNRSFGTGRGGFGGGGGNLGSPGWWTDARQSHAVAELQKGGVSELGAKALVSRWMNVEASGGPSTVNSIGATGIGQWLGARKAGLPSDLDGQIRHALGELHGSESRALGYLNSGSAVGAATGASQFERAEGYNSRTGTDNFTGKTLRGMGRVHAGEEHPALKAPSLRQAPAAPAAMTTAQLEGQGHIRVEIVAKDHRIASSYARSSGHIRTSVGPTMA